TTCCRRRGAPNLSVPKARPGPRSSTWRRTASKPTAARSRSRSTTRRARGCCRGRSPWTSCSSPSPGSEVPAPAVQAHHAAARDREREQAGGDREIRLELDLLRLALGRAVLPVAVRGRRRDDHERDERE